MGVSAWRRVAVGAYISLIVLTLLWEGWLAPAAQAPPGLWLTLKSIPLLFPLFGLLHGKRYTFAWASMLILAYFAEGITLAVARRTAWTLHSPAPYALLEAVLSLVFFVAAIWFIRRSAHASRQNSIE